MSAPNIQLFPIPMWIYDVDTLKFLEVNDAALAHYGYTKDEFMSLTLMDIRPPEDRPMLETAIEMLKLHKISYQKRLYRHQKKNGEIIYVEVSGNVFEQNGQLLELIIIIDITRLMMNDQLTQEIQEKLLTVERRFKAMVQEGSDMISIVDFKGNITFTSENYFTLLGHHPGEICGKNAFDYIHYNDRENVWNSLQKLKQVKCVTVPPFRFLNSKNQWRWITTIMTNMLNDEAIGGIVTNSKDITDTVTKKKELSKRNKELKEIAWTQSHQVRAPLSRAIALIDLLEREDNLSDDQKQLLEHLSASTRELDLMIKAIVKKIESKGKRKK